MDSDRLLSICAGLGLAEEDENGAITSYAKGEYCLDSLKDLQRFLRRDDPYKRDIFNQVCKWNTVSRDLIPIIEFYQNERNLVINSVKILVFLTMPVDQNSHDIAQQIEYLWDLKFALSRNVTIAIIVSLLEDPLDHLESDTFNEEDWKLVQLILTLFRNLLAIQQLTLHQKACGSATKFLQLADNFLEIIFQENVMDIILVLTQHLEEFFKDDKLLFLEIFHYIFLGRDAEMVSKSSLKKDGEISNTVDSLKLIMEKEAKKRKKIGQRSLERHSQLSGTFTRFFMDGSKTLYKGMPGLGPEETLLKVHKLQRGPQKRIACDRQLIISPKENLLESLRSFLEQFLSGGYNVLMQSIRNDIKKEHHSIQNNDIITFFQVVQFVLSFQYHHISISKKNEEKSENLNICGPVAETVNEEMFKLVISRWQEIFEGIKQTNDYKSLSATGSLMKHMIFMIDLVLKLEPDDSKETHTCRVLLYKLFYDQTEQGLTHFILNLFKSFDMHKQPKSDLADMLEIIHVIFRLMDSLQQRGTLRVAKKARRIKKKKVPKIPPEDTLKNPTEPSRSSEDQPFEETNPTVGPTEPSRSSENQSDRAAVPTESSRSSETQPTDETNQTLDPMEPSSNSPTQLPNQLNPSVGPTEPFRSSPTQLPNKPSPSVDPTEPSRSSEEQLDPAVNPTEPSTSSPNQLNPFVGPTEPSRKSPAQLNPSLNPAEPSRNPEEANPDPLFDTQQGTAGFLSNEETSDDDDDDSALPAVNEVDFNVSRLVTSFVTNTVVHNLCWLLKHYKSNSVRTNHYIVCMLRRICDDLGMTAMLYQLSLLKTFYEIILEQKSSKSKEYSTIVNFLTKHVRDMMKLFAKQPLLFVKILFWKTRRECHHISADALISEAVNMRNGINSSIGTQTGTGFGFNKSISDSLGDDEADLVPNYDEILREDNYSDVFNKSLSDSLGDDDADLVPNYNDQNQREDNENEGEKTEKSTNKRRRLSKSGSVINLDVPSVKVAKRRRSSLFSPLQEITIKDLYEKHKDDRKCCKIIAEAIDPNGDMNISPAQISRKLKQLGLRNNIGKKKNEKTESPVSLSSSSDDEPLKTLITRRKRGKDVLNEKSQINEINEELDSDNEPLGSIFSQRKKNKGKDVLNEKSQINEINEELDSDNEPLGSIFSQRKKNKGKDVLNENSQINEINEGLDSDNEPLGSIFSQKKRNKRGKDVLNELNEGSDSDNETLGSIIRQRKKNKGKDVLNESNEGLDFDNETSGSIIRKKNKRMKDDLNEKYQINEINEELDLDNEPLGSIISQKKKNKRKKDVLNEKNEGSDSDNEPLGSIIRNKSKSQVPIKSPDKRTSIDMTDLDDDIDSEPENMRKVKNNELNLLEDSDDETLTTSQRNIGSKRTVNLVLDDDEDI